MDSPRGPRRRVRPGLESRTARRGRRRTRRRGGAVRRYPRRRVAEGRAGHRLRPGEPRHRRDGEPASGARTAIAEYGEKVAVGLDVQIVDGEHRLRGRGWETDGGDLWQVLERLDGEGCSRFVVTDVTKDGTLTGPNLELLSGVAERPKRRSLPRVACPASTICVRSRRSPARRRGRNHRKGPLCRPIHAAGGTGRGRDPADGAGRNRRSRRTGLRGRRDSRSVPFVHGGPGRRSAVQKKGNDFATEVDLAIERQVVDALIRAPESGCTGRRSAAQKSTRRWCGCSTQSTARSTTPRVCLRRHPAGLMRDGSRSPA